MFTRALFTTVKIWKQSKCPSTDEWIKEINIRCVCLCVCVWCVCVYVCMYYLAIKKNEILPFTTILMGMEGIMLSEISQTQKDKYRMISLLNLKNKSEQT